MVFFFLNCTGISCILWCQQRMAATSSSPGQLGCSLRTAKYGHSIIVWPRVTKQTVQHLHTYCLNKIPKSILNFSFNKIVRLLILRRVLDIISDFGGRGDHRRTVQVLLTKLHQVQTCLFSKLLVSFLQTILPFWD